MHITIFGIKINVNKESVLGTCSICKLPVINARKKPKTDQQDAVSLLFDLSLEIKEIKDDLILYYHEMCLDNEKYFKSSNPPEEYSVIQPEVH